MQGAGFFIGFFVILVLLAIVTADGDGVLKERPAIERSESETVESRSETNTRTETISAPVTQTYTPPPQPSPRLTPAEIEQKLARLYRELDDLEDEARELKLRSPISPYFGDVDLRIGNARSTDPEREYLTLYAKSSNDAPIAISNWYLESYVTEEVAAIPEGSRVMERFRTREISPIFLEPGERAYVITGDPPFNVSFHENICTGYLRDINDDIYPSLRRSCPRPLDELEAFGGVDYDNDACYEVIEDISRCELVDESELEDANVSRACEVFVRDYLNYDSCVEHHRYEPYFDDTGYWRIYLSRDRSDDDIDEDEDSDFTPDLWRREREIIRLMDEQDRVVDVIDY